MQPSESIVLNFLSPQELRRPVGAVFINGPYEQGRAEDSAVYAPRMTAPWRLAAGRLSTIVTHAACITDDYWAG